MSLEKVTRRQFNQLIGTTSILFAFSPLKAVAEFSNWTEHCDDEFQFNSKDFYYTHAGNSEEIQKYLSQQKEVKRKLRIGERTFKEKKTRSVQQWIENGILPDIKYQLSYSSGWAQALTSLPWVNSEIKIDIIGSEDRDDLFKLDTIRPDYKFIRKTSKGKTILKEELTGTKTEYELLQDGILNQQGEKFLDRTDLTIHSRVTSLYHNFREFLSTKSSAELPLFIAGKTWPVTVHVNRITEDWFSVYSIFNHDKTKLMEDSSFEKFRVKRVDVRIYMPPEANIGLPDECRMTMIKYQINEQHHRLDHDHIQVYGKLKT